MLAMFQTHRYVCLKGQTVGVELCCLAARGSPTYMNLYLCGHVKLPLSLTYWSQTPPRLCEHDS